MTDDPNQNPEEGQTDPAPGTPLVTEQVKTSGSFQMPADYYSQPPEHRSASNRGCPRWVPIGCGIGGCLVLVLLFVFAFLIARGASSSRFTLWFTNRVEIEMRGLMTADVTQQQRAAYDQEFARLRTNIESEKVTFLQLQEWLEQTRAAMGDQKLTPQEVDSLVEVMRRVNERGSTTPTSTGDAPKTETTTQR